MSPNDALQFPMNVAEPVPDNDSYVRPYRMPN
jgi:hypothetical protein